MQMQALRVVLPSRIQEMRTLLSDSDQDDPYGSSNAQARAAQSHSIRRDWETPPSVANEYHPLTVNNMDEVSTQEHHA